MENARWKIIAAISALLFVVLMVGACRTANVHETARGSSLHDRVISAGEIHCAYVVYPPACIKDPNTGRLSGIGVEILDAVGKSLGLKVVWTEEVGWSAMIEGLLRDRYDIIGTPLWANSERAKLVSFSRPVYYSPVCAYARTGDNRFKQNLNSINSNKIKIATIDGGTVDVIAKSDFPKAAKFSLPQLSDVSQLLLNVSTGKADVTFAEPAVAYQFMTNNPGKLTKLSGKPVRVFADNFMFKRGETDFKEMFDTVLEELINSGAVTKIIRKYEPYPGAYLEVAKPYQAEGLERKGLESIKGISSK